MIFTSSANTLLQLSSPDHLRGRVMSVYSMVFTGTAPFGALITGYLAGAIQVRPTLAIEATLCLLAPLIALAYLRRRAPALRAEPELAAS